MEGGLAATDAQAFEEAMEASKTHVIRLIQEVAEAEDIYDSGEVTFDKMLASVAEEIKVYIQQQGTDAACCVQEEMSRSGQSRIMVD